jgi:hypothetical protein
MHGVTPSPALRCAAAFSLDQVLVDPFLFLFFRYILTPYLAVVARRLLGSSRLSTV